MDCAIRLADIDDIPEIKKIADQNKKEIGFILKPIIEASAKTNELFVAFYQNRVAGFIRWHKRQDGWSTVYEICVDQKFRRIGIGRRLMARIPKPIQLKCPIDNEFNRFYRRLGFILTGQEPGKKRTLNIWIKQ